jgi:hypothetical protein
MMKRLRPRTEDSQLNIGSKSVECGCTPLSVCCFGAAAVAAVAAAAAAAAAHTLRVLNRQRAARLTNPTSCFALVVLLLLPRNG